MVNEGRTLPATEGTLATLEEAHRARWFWAELSASDGAVTVMAVDEQGDLIEEHTLTTGS